MSVGVKSVNGQAVLTVNGTEVAVFDPATLPLFNSTPIIERGSNTYGDYVRFADGTQICTGQASWGIPAGSSRATSFTFPATFSVSDSLSEISVTGIASEQVFNGGANVSFVTHLAMAGSNSMGHVTATNNYSANLTAKFTYTATGRWK